MLESEDGSAKRMQIVVHKNRLSEVLRYLHDGISGGQLGVTKTFQKMRKRFY